MQKWLVTTIVRDRPGQLPKARASVSEATLEDLKLPRVETHTFHDTYRDFFDTEEEARKFAKENTDTR